MARTGSGMSIFSPPGRELRSLKPQGKLEASYEADPENSWLIAAAEKDLPIVTPGWCFVSEGGGD